MYVCTYVCMYVCTLAIKVIDYLNRIIVFVFRSRLLLLRTGSDRGRTEDGHRDKYVCMYVCMYIRGRAATVQVPCV